MSNFGEQPEEDSVQIPLPYNLKKHELVLEPQRIYRSMWEQLDWLHKHPNASDPVGELERIFRSAVILHHWTDKPFEKCFDTAIIWERG